MFCCGVEAGVGGEPAVCSCVDDKTAKKGNLLHLVHLQSCQCTVNSHLRQLQLDCVHISWMFVCRVAVESAR